MCAATGSEDPYSELQSPATLLTVLSHFSLGEISVRASDDSDRTGLATISN